MKDTVNSKEKAPKAAVKNSVVGNKEPYYLEVCVGALPRMMNSQGRSTHRFVVMRERREWKNIITVLAKAHLPARPLPRAKIKFTRRSSVQPDPDNLVAGFKPCLDGLVVAGVLENDRWDNIGMPDYNWEKVKSGHGSIMIQLWEA